jgi:hypothetical protein
MWRVAVICAACALLALVPACGDDDPVKPPDNPPPNDTGIPPVPVMTDPDTDPATRSTVRSVVRKASDFAPVIDGAFCSWEITGRGRFESFSGGWIDCSPPNWESLYTGVAWSDGRDAIDDYMGCFTACGLLTNYCPESYSLDIENWPEDTRFVFMKDDIKDPMPNTIEWNAPEKEICREELPLVGCINKVHVTIHYRATGQPVDKTPYLRRDRFWVAIPWDTGAMVERTTGDESITLTSTYTSGCAQTQTESFGYSLGATVGAEYKGIKAEVEGSISHTFGSSFTVTEQTEESVSRTLQGEAGKRTCFVMWVLIEQYSWVDGDGNPYSDPNYIFDRGFYDEGGDAYYAFQSCGMQYEIGKYVFDLDTNQLVSMERVPLR